MISVHNDNHCLHQLPISSKTCAKSETSCIGVEDYLVEELDVASEGEAAPLPEAFFADEEVDVLSLEALKDLLLSRRFVHDSSKLFSCLRHIGKHTCRRI